MMKKGGDMKKIALFLMVFVFAFAAFSFAGGSCKASAEAKNGWQMVYDDMASWSWGGGKSSSADKKEGKMACGCSEGKCTCKK